MHGLYGRLGLAESLPAVIGGGMTRHLRKLALATTLIGCLPAFSAVAASRVWVSGHGVDQAGCGSPAAPCRSLQYAHDAVAASGEIDVLDPAGYGSVTITKAVSIVNDGVGTAGVQATLGNAIVINAGPTDAVHLRGLNIDGLGTASNGIVFNTGGSLSVVNCVVRHFAFLGQFTTGNGIMIAPTSGTMNFVISNTIAADNADVGVFYFPQSGNASVTGVIDHVLATNDQFGVAINTNAAVPVSTYFTISNTVASGDQLGIELESTSSYTVLVDSSYVTGNSSGIFINGPTTALLGRSVVSLNIGTGITNNTTSNSLYSYSNNEINRNAVDIGGNTPSLNYSFGLR